MGTQQGQLCKLEDTNAGNPQTERAPDVRLCLRRHDTATASHTTFYFLTSTSDENCSVSPSKRRFKAMKGMNIYVLSAHCGSRLFQLNRLDRESAEHERGNNETRRKRVREAIYLSQSACRPVRCACRLWPPTGSPPAL